MLDKRRIQPPSYLLLLSPQTPATVEQPYKTRLTPLKMRTWAKSGEAICAAQVQQCLAEYRALHRWRRDAHMTYMAHDAAHMLRCLF